MAKSFGRALQRSGEAATRNGNELKKTKQAPPRTAAEATPQPATAQAAPGGAAAVDRALSLLSAFQQGERGLTLTELAARTGLYKSTALRLLSSLVAAGYLDREEDGLFVIGAEVARLHGIYAASFSLDRAIPAALRQLVEETGESASYQVRRGEGAQAVRLCLYRVDSPHPVRDHARAGDVLPLNRGVGARVLIAFDEALQKGAGAKDRQLYEKIRAQGYCAMTGDRTADLGGVSAPVLRPDGTLVGAVTLTMPTHRFKQAYVEPVVRAARRLGGLA